jgi:tetratricopeptide (TPR) repeat protein
MEVSQSDFVTRGQALVSSGQYQEAVKVCRLGLLGRPTTVEGRVVLGQALLALKRYDEVLAEMRVALELDHGSVTAQVLKGEALLRKGDGHGALEVLARLRAEGTADPHVVELIAEAERLAGRSPANTSHPSVSFLSEEAATLAADQGTKNYPSYQASALVGDDSNEDTGGEYTRPTTLAAPSARKLPAAALSSRLDATPSPAVLAVGDRSGTVEVDPELEALDLHEDDFGDVVGPPVGPGARAVTDAAARNGARGATKPATRSARAPAPAASQPARAPLFKDEVSTVELDDEAMLEVAETLSPASPGAVLGRRPGPGTAVRNAVKMPSGPIDLDPPPPPASLRPSVLPPPPHLAQMLANQPHALNLGLPGPPQPRHAPAATLPAAAAVPMPLPAPQLRPLPPPPVLPPPPLMPRPLAPQPSFASQPPAMPPHLQLPLSSASQLQQMEQLPAHLSSNIAAVRPTLALNPMQQQSAAAVDAMFNGQDAPPAWARATMLPVAPPSYGARAAADEPTRQPHELDPRIAALLAGQGSGGVPAAAFTGEPSSSTSRSARTGARRGRSRLQILVWILIGAAVIAGGVFAGLQIRTIRLRKQIAAARDRAVDLARADTWQGWLGARDSLYSIAQASPTVDNRAALARARGVLAYEFGDGVADARAAIDGLAGQAGLDLDLATAYVALAQNDVKLARELAERAKQEASNDAAALYVSGQASLLAGDVKTAIEELRHAVEREARPLYVTGLARALGASSAWDDALATVDRVPDNPAAAIAKGFLMAGAGRVTGGPGIEIRAQLAKVIAEGARPPGEQTRGVSPSQIAFADLALAQVDFARNEATAAHADYRASLDVQLNDQRFAEELIDTVYAIGELDTARRAAALALDKWPASRRARTTLAQALLGSAKPAAALELFTKTPDAAGWPRGQTVRGQARLATADIDGARADFDAALRKLPGFEPALIARAWLDVASGDIDDARQRIEPRFNAKTATPAMLAVYAAILRATGDPAARDKAKGLLERVVGGGPGPDTARAQLELARIDRDLGDMPAARAMYADASRGGNFDARLETGLLQIEDSDPSGGRETLEQLLKETGEHPPASLLLETARARALVGAHAGAAELLAVADKTPGVVRWQLDRERARLALRKNDTAGAALALVRALDGCGADVDSFILAADTVSADDKQTALAQKLNALVPVRLKGRPEVEVIAGKLHLAAGGALEEADRAYHTARDSFMKEKASARRRAQAAYGLAAVAYFRRDDPTATTDLELTTAEDPSIYSAYLFSAEIARPKAPRDALKLAQQAASYNPDSLDAWKLVGTLAAQLGNRQLLSDAITRVNELAPGSDALRQLQSLR